MISLEAIAWIVTYLCNQVTRVFGPEPNEDKGSNAVCSCLSPAHAAPHAAKHPTHAVTRVYLRRNAVSRDVSEPVDIFLRVLKTMATNKSNPEHGIPDEPYTPQLEEAFLS